MYNRIHTMNTAVHYRWKLLRESILRVLIARETIFSFFFFFGFLGPLLWHMEIPRLGGPVGAAAASLHHSHSNSGSQPCLWPTPQLMVTLDPDPLSEARDQNCIFMGTSWIRFHCATMGTTKNFLFLEFCSYMTWWMFTKLIVIIISGCI